MANTQITGECHCNKRVSLSEDQVWKLVVEYWGGIPPAILLKAEVEFVRAIEAAHGIGGEK